MNIQVFLLSICLGVTSVFAAENPPSLPDLTQNRVVDRDQTYNLGATGMRGWIYTKAANNLDSWQGRTTLISRQILVTHVGKKSPADGVMKVDDVILGVAGAPFTDDARKGIAMAIQAAENETNRGVLNLLVWRAGKITNQVITLKVMGAYSATAPYHCPKSKLIFEEACNVLEKEALSSSWTGAVNGLALMATGDSKYLSKVRKYAREVGPKSLSLKDKRVDTWDWGYRNLFLCEYFLLTNDRDVMHAIEEYTIALAKGQSLYGTFGHGGSDLNDYGELHGSVPPYGPVNAAGLIANISIVLGRKCGVKHPEVEPAINRASRFFGYYMDKGAIPYGEHMPWPNHDNNGKNAMTAMLFALQENKVKETRFFAKMITASHRCREYGHTGQGFSYLWGGLGANTGGPLAAAGFFNESSWHLDLVRRSDGSFTYDGDEQYGAGKTADHTYFGNSGYNGLSPTASYVLTYALPLKQIYLTGREANPAHLLGKEEVVEAIASGKFDTSRKTLSEDKLIEAFKDWSPIVRGWAAEELGTRPAGKKYTRRLITMAEGPDGRMRQGAAETLGYLKDPDAAKVLTRLLMHEDRWLRVKAATALKSMGQNAKPVVPDMLKALADTAVPVYPVVWEDPIQLTHGELAATLFKGLLARSIEGINPKLLYPAIRAVANNPDAMARGALGGTFKDLLTEKDIEKLAPDLVQAIKIIAPADTMFSGEVRMGAFLALTKYHYKEGIDAGVVFAKTQGGHGSEVRTAEIMQQLATYGSAAQSAIPDLKELIKEFDAQTARNEFPKDINGLRTTAVKNTIKSIEAAKSHPPLKMLSAVIEKPVNLVKRPEIDQPITRNSTKRFGTGEITILTTSEGANLPASASLDNFPMLVRIHKDWFDFKQVKPTGEDIRFTDSNGKQLAYQVEEWDPVAGTASIWVLIPHIAGNARQSIQMHWANSSAVSKSDGKSVFNDTNGYLSVWHMDDPTKDEVETLKTTDAGTTSVAGMIGKARRFAGKQGISAGENITNYPTQSSPHSSEAWIRADRSNGKIITWGKDQNQGKVVMAFASPPHVVVGCYFSGADVAGKSALPLSEWTHVVHTYEKGDSRIYINGVLDGVSTSQDAPLNLPSSSGLWLGGWKNDYDFLGDIDEVRVSKVKRSADWIKLQYENQKALQTLTGPIIQPGEEFLVNHEQVTIAEGNSITIAAKAGGAQKVSWILKADGKETVVATDRFSFAFDAGRVTGNRKATLQFKAVYPDGIKTKDIPIFIQETIEEPLFSLKAPTTWDGRTPIEITAQVGNMAAMQAKQAGDLNITWKVSGIAATHEVRADKLLLKRAQNSGKVVVTATVSNGGKPTVSSTTLQVTEPKQDAWSLAVPTKDEQPEDGQFYGRDDKDEGTLFYNGSLTQATDSVFLKVYADGELYKEEVTKLATDQSYKFAVKLKAGLIKYKAEFGTILGGKETIVRTVNDVVCGDVYLVNGQSNAVATAWGDKEFPETNEWIRSFGGAGDDPTVVRWGPAIRRAQGDRLAIGFWAFDLAKRLMESHKMPICILNGAVGGTRIDQHQRSSENGEDLSSIYGRLLWRVRQAKLSHGVRGIFWHQGENDQGADGPTGGYGWENYRRYFLDLAGSWKQDYPNVQHYYIFQIWPYSCSMGQMGSDSRLREVQRSLPAAFSRMSIMSTLGIDPPGGCHYPPEGYAEFARLIFPLVEQFNYGIKPTVSITSPDLKKASFTSSKRDEVALEFDQPVKWDAILKSQFYFDGEDGKVVSGKSQGNALILKLNSTSGAQDITYLNGQSWSQKTILRGANGIAALTFCEIPIISVKK
jgi:HEAT repeat protein